MSTPGIVAQRASSEIASPKSPEKNTSLRAPLARARQRHDFARTAASRLRYELPDPKTALTEAGLRDWLPRLDLTERQYEKLVDMGLAESVRRNSQWSLASWLGVIVELKGGAG